MKYRLNIRGVCGEEKYINHDVALSSVKKFHLFTFIGSIVDYCRYREFSLGSQIGLCLDAPGVDVLLSRMVGYIMKGLRK